MRTQQPAHDVGSGIVGVLVERGTWSFPILRTPTLKSPHPPHRRVPHCPTTGTKSPKNLRHEKAEGSNSINLVGVTGFEPATSSSRTPRSSRRKPCLRWPARIWMKPNVLDRAVVAVLRCCTDLRVRRFGQTVRAPVRRFLVGWRRQLPGEPSRSADANCCQAYALRVASRKSTQYQVRPRFG